MVHKLGTLSLVLPALASLACGEPDDVMEPVVEEPEVGEASLHLTSDGAPAVNVKVYVSLPDGELQETSLTDGDGVARATISAGSLFTFISQRDAYSIVVSPGDSIDFPVTSFAGGAFWRLQPSAPELEGAEHYVFSTCYGVNFESDDSVYADDACRDVDGAISALAFAYTSSPYDGGQPLAYLTTKKMLDEAELDTAMEFTGDWQTDFDQLSVAIEPAPAASGTMSLEVDLVRDGHVYGGLTADATEQGGTVGFVPGFGTDQLWETSSWSGSGSTSVAQLASQGTTVDGTTFLVEPEADYTTSGPWTVSWSGAGDVAVAWHLFRTTSGEIGLWNLIGPAQATALVLPVLPPETGMPSRSEALDFSTFDVTTYDYDDVDGFLETSAAGRLSNLGFGRDGGQVERLLLAGQTVRWASVYLSSTAGLITNPNTRYREHQVRLRQAAARAANR